MGTDIYEQFEVRRNGIWEPVNLLPDFDPDTATDDEFIAFGNHPASINRNYALFAILANVHNTFGLKPIALPRGLPENVSTQGEGRVKGIYDVSWVTLDELLNYEWNQIIHDSRHPHVRPESCRDSVEPFLTHNLPYLLSQVDNPSDFRIVFGFG